jgi:hypothetical protein
MLAHPSRTKYDHRAGCRTTKRNTEINPNNHCNPRTPFNLNTYPRSPPTYRQTGEEMGLLLPSRIDEKQHSAVCIWALQHKKKVLVTLLPPRRPRPIAVRWPHMEEGKSEWKEKFSLQLTLESKVLEKSASCRKIWLLPIFNIIIIIIICVGRVAQSV